MRAVLRMLAVACGLSAAAAVWPTNTLVGQADGAQVFLGARLIDGRGGAAIEGGVLVVRNGRVEAAGAADAVTVPAGARTVDVTGRTIMPGLVNTHGHVAATQGLRSGPEFYTGANVLRQLRLYALYGITTVFSLGDDGDAAFRARDAQDSAPPDRARLFVAGPVISATTPGEARAMVNTVADMKPDLIKIRVDDNLGTSKKMTPDVYRAVIDAAHARGLRVAVHVFYLEDAKGVLDAGADFIGHSVRDRDVDAEFIARLKQRDICVSPTLMREVSVTVYDATPDFFSDPFFLRAVDPEVIAELNLPEKQAAMRDSPAAQAYRRGLAVARRNLRALKDAGVRIALGTDTGPPARFQGYFEHRELQMMTDAGLTPAQALMTGLGDAARCMKAESRIGTLAPGTLADFLVLTENPLENVRNTRSIESVWIGGKELTR